MTELVQQPRERDRKPCCPPADPMRIIALCKTFISFSS